MRSLLSKPVFPKGFSGKYLDANLNVDVAQDAQKAIEVMKKIIENNTEKSKDSNATSQKRQRTQKLRSKKIKRLKKA